MQLLKFGKLVDLEKLETVSVNRAAEELKEQLRTQEFGNAKEIAAWEVRVIGLGVEESLIIGWTDVVIMFS